MDANRKSIGQIIKRARLAKNLTQNELAERIGKQRSYISRVETDSGDNIKIHTFIDIIENGLGGSVKIEF